jgi:DivIVA domain-containing protein
MRCRECTAKVAATARVCSRCGAPISSPRWGKAFLGTVEIQSALQPRLLDEKVSGVILADWAAWAASTTFSSNGLRLGYDKPEVDAFRSAIRDTFLGGAVFWVSTPPVRSDDLRGKQFSIHRRGYDKKQVDAFLEAAGLSLAAMESTDRPAGPLVSGALLVGWAEWVESTRFSKPNWRRRGYEPMEVDAVLNAIRDTFLGVRKPPVRSDNLRGKQFSSTDADHPGYDKRQVGAFLDAAGIRLAAMESTDRPERPLVSGAILAEWAEWADSTRFSTAPRLREGYAMAEVDAFRQEISRHVPRGKATPSARQPEPARTEARYVPVVLDYPWLVAAWLRRAGG